MLRQRWFDSTDLGKTACVKGLWPHVVTAALLVAATVVAGAAGRAVDAAITGAVALLPIGFLAFYAIGRRKGFVQD